MGNATYKLYCLLESCIWRTSDNICSWTKCPYNKRILVKQPAPEPQPPMPREKDAKSKKAKPVIGTDSTGKEYRYKSISAAARAHGVWPNNIANALRMGHLAAGLHWRWESDSERVSKPLSGN